MSNINPVLAGGNSPGVFTSEGTYGANPATPRPFDTAYMAIHADSGPVGVPTLVEDVEALGNIFGPTLSTDSVELFYNQRPGVTLTVINIEARDSYAILADDPTATGETYSVIVDTVPISVESQEGENGEEVLARLATLVNGLLDAVSIREGFLRVATGTTATVSANITLDAVTPAAVYPTLKDLNDGLERAIKPELRPGFLLAPEFFQNSGLPASDVQQVLEAVASSPARNWVAIADPSPEAAGLEGYSPSAAIAQMLAERNDMGSSRGHTFLSGWPYYKNLEGDPVPPSAATAAQYLRSYRERGFQTVGAGPRYPVLGVTGTTVETTEGQQDLMNPQGINVIRKFPGRGYLLYGARTLSKNAFWKFVNTRVIFSVWGRTLQEALADFPFEVVDGRGIFFGQLKATAIQIAEVLRLGDALFGQTPDDAYLIVCDETNNPPALLDSGQVNLACYGKPSPIAERINGALFRVSLGTDFAEITGAEEEDIDLADDGSGA